MVEERGGREVCLCGIQERVMGGARPHKGHAREQAKQVSYKDSTLVLLWPTICLRTTSTFTGSSLSWPTSEQRSSRGSTRATEPCGKASLRYCMLVLHVND